MTKWNKITSNGVIFLLKNIIDKCDEEELMILKDIILATFPNLSKIKTKRKD